MSFFKPTVDDALSTFTRALNKLHKAAENLREELDVQQEIINEATTRKLVISREVVRAEHLTKKFEDFLK